MGHVVLDVTVNVWGRSHDIRVMLYEMVACSGNGDGRWGQQMGPNPLFDRHLSNLVPRRLNKVCLLHKVQMSLLVRVRLGGLTVMVSLYTYC